MNKYIDKFILNNKKVMDGWLKSPNEIKKDELYRFLHSMAGTAPTIGLDNVGHVSRKLMNEIVERGKESWTPIDIQELLFSLISYFNITSIPKEEVSTRHSERKTGDEQTILIIDKVTTMLMYLKEELQKQGWYVIVIADPIKAVLSYYDYQPDCVIIGIHNNDNDGYGVFSSLQQKVSHQFVPTIILSSNDDKEMRMKCYEMGADEFILTPFDLEELVVRIRRHLKRKELIDNSLLIDELTGVYNRKYLKRAFASLDNDLNRRKEPFCIAVLDLDYFKKINDKFGHVVGDEVLKSFASYMTERTRKNDVVIRFGGEEFIIMFSGMTSTDAYPVLELLLRSFSTHQFTFDTEPFYCTFSGGMVDVNKAGESLTNWIELADSALYEAKDAGRNQIKLVNQMTSHVGRKSLNVAVIDDDPIIRSVLMDLLDKVGQDSAFDFDIQSFKDGQAFFSDEWHRGKEGNYLIILDGIMPKMDGLEVLQRLRSSDQSNKYTVIMLTSRRSERDISRALKLGADDYITKPFKLLELESRIRHLLKRVR
ncbi:diguanylate cyclase [Litchfieldia alkalitelluris]|uniref:diguanylate cyclase n=1 Tax=Litchfieldia alkalitelluris TaxID=304268 RepID=UPI0009977A2A|nr:diguanylate cyclase [Litchfieldia alkalitelluris]